MSDAQVSEWQFLTAANEYSGCPEVVEWFTGTRAEALTYARRYWWNFGVREIQNDSLAVRVADGEILAPARSAGVVRRRKK